MRWFWRPRHSAPARQRTHSRPRVALAAAAAQQVQQARAQSATGLGNATAGPAIYLAPGAGVPPALSASTSLPAYVSAARGLPPELLRATISAAWAVGRAPEEVWGEALREWLAAQEERAAQGAPALAGAAGTRRRQESWLQIEETLRALRAS